MMSTPLSITHVRERLAPLFADPNIDLVVLFGSVATGVSRAESDLDVAVRGGCQLDLVSVTNQMSQLLHTDAIDVVDLRRASPLLLMEVVRGGTLLYERVAGSYTAFCSLAHRRYVDTAKLRLAQRETIQQFLLARGVA